MASLLLRLWLSVAIYRAFIKLTYGSLPNECYESDQQYTSFYCNRIDIDKAVTSIPSNATRLEVRYSKQVNLSLSFKNYLPALISLKLTNGGLTRIKSASFSELVHLEVLSLKNNELSQLEEETLFGLLSLRTLDVSGNKFVFLNDLIPILFHIGNLTSLDLSRNPIKSISFANIEKLSNHSIGKVDFSRCNISRANPFVISNWNIHELHISYNPIDEKCWKNISLGLQNSSVTILVVLKLSSLTHSLNESLLSPLYSSKIQTLIIGETEFTFNLTFRSFVSLKRLQIVNSNIYGLDLDALLMLPNLRSLQLTAIKIQRLYVTNVISEESNLEILDVTIDLGLTLHLIPQNIFPRLPNLKELNLKGVMFGHTITRQTFLWNKNLLKLILIECFLERVEDFAFQNLRRLESLYLGGNRLQSLRNEMFLGLHNLTTLYLDNNAISFVDDPCPFSCLSNLEVLILSNNNIKYLRPPFFANLTNLNAINLNNNAIVPWNVSIIPEGGKISFMLLRSNELNTVTPAMLKDFDTLERVNLAYNNFDCGDCHIHEFQQWILSTNVTIEEFDKSSNGGTKYTCFSPIHLKATSIMDVTVDKERCVLKEEKTLLLAVAASCAFLTIATAGMISFRLRWHFRYCCYLLRSHVKRFREVQDSFSYEYDAFVSYDPADCDWIVNRLLATLENGESNIKFCLLDRDHPAGNDVVQEILEVIQKCRKTLLVLSESYVKNQWCVFAMQMAQHSLFEEKRDSLILIQLEPMEEKVISANLEYLITTRTYIVWTDHPVGQKLFWKRLLSALAKPDTFRMSRIV